jgi:hypothetical protein
LVYGVGPGRDGPWGGGQRRRRHRPACPAASARARRPASGEAPTSCPDAWRAPQTAGACEPGAVREGRDWAAAGALGYRGGRGPRASYRPTRPPARSRAPRGTRRRAPRCPPSAPPSARASSAARPPRTPAAPGGRARRGWEGRGRGGEEARRWVSAAAPGPLGLQPGASEAASQAAVESALDRRSVPSPRSHLPRAAHDAGGVAEDVVVGCHQQRGAGVARELAGLKQQRRRLVVSQVLPGQQDLGVGRGWPPELGRERLAAGGEAGPGACGAVACSGCSNEQGPILPLPLPPLPPARAHTWRGMSPGSVRKPAPAQRCVSAHGASLNSRTGSTTRHTSFRMKEREP